MSRVKALRHLSLEEQHAILRVHPLTREGTGGRRRGVLTWEFEAAPGPLARVYRLRLSLAENSYPTMIVLQPDLVALADGRELPHVYSEYPVELCLFHPRRRDWRPHQSLVETMVAWAITWLFFFEDWLGGTAWEGGGEHPAPRAPRRSAANRRRRLLR